jgi:hypothetical protein
VVESIFEIVSTELIDFEPSGWCGVALGLGGVLALTRADALGQPISPLRAAARTGRAFHADYCVTVAW